VLYYYQDAAQAEALLGSSISRTQPATPTLIKPTISTPADVEMAVDELSSPLGTIGTPVQLAPSSSAFRKPGAGGKNLALSIAAPKSQDAWTAAPSQGAAAPQKGVFGQVTDMIFGW
jgi:nuclear pore complex protein Nup53